MFGAELRALLGAGEEVGLPACSFLVESLTVFTLGSHLSHLEDLLKYKFLGLTVRVSDSVLWDQGLSFHF